MRMSFFLLMAYGLFVVSFASSTAIDKEYREVFDLIEDDKISEAIKKLKKYISLGKSEDKSTLLLAKLYSMNGNYRSSLDTLYSISSSEKDPMYWGVLLNTLNKSYAKNKKMEPLERLKDSVLGYIKYNKNYSPQGRKLLEQTFSYYKNVEVRKKYCQNLLKVSNQKCQK